LALALVAGTAAGGQALGGRSNPIQTEAVGGRPCPTNLVVGGGTVDDAIAAVRRIALPRIRPEAQGRTYQLDATNAPVRVAVYLNTFDFDGDADVAARGLRMVATKRCGAKTARGSWGIVVSNPFVLIASDNRITFFAVRTRSGWAIY
jgi:hypothetical protein